MVVWESMPDEGVAVGAPVLGGEDHPGQVLEVDLVADAGARRDHPEAVEGPLGPAQQLVALEVALVLDVDVVSIGAGVPDRSAITEWSITSSTGTRGLIRRGSPPIAARASRMAARSTTAGTPVKSCMRTRSGLKAISCASSPPRCRGPGVAPQAATAAMSAARPAGRPRGAAGSPGAPSWCRAAGPRRGRRARRRREREDLERPVADVEGRPGAEAVGWGAGSWAMTPFCPPSARPGAPWPGRGSCKPTSHARSTSTAPIGLPQWLTMRRKFGVGAAGVLVGLGLWAGALFPAGPAAILVGPAAASSPSSPPLPGDHLDRSDPSERLSPVAASSGSATPTGPLPV